MTRDTRDTARSLFLVAIMVFSVFGGAVALSGGAAASVSYVTASAVTGTADNAAPGDTVTVQSIKLSDQGSGSGSATNVNQFNIDLSGSEITSTDIASVSVQGPNGQYGTTSSVGTLSSITVSGSDSVSDGGSKTYDVQVTLASSGTVTSSDGSTITSSATANVDDGGSNSGTTASVSTQNADQLDLAPSVTGASLSSTSSVGDSGTFVSGETVNVDVTYNEKVSVDTTGGTPSIDLGAVTADYASGDGSSTLTFSYTVQDGDSGSLSLSNNIVLNSGTITDADQGGQSAGLLTSSESFSGSPSIDTTAPSVQSRTPTDNANDVSTTTDLTLNFGETVQAGSGNVVIKKQSDDSTFATIDITTGSKVTFNSNTVTINPDSDLAAGTGYYVQVDSGAIQDTAGNDWSGISDKTSWSFTTDLAASISSNPPGQGQSATHTVTWTLDKQVSAQTYEIAYPSGGADISNVGTSDIVALGIDGNDDGALDSASDTNFTDLNQVSGGDGHVLTVDTSSSHTVNAGETLVLKYKDVQNPNKASDSVDLRINPQSGDVDVTRSLAYGTDIPSVDQVTLNGEAISANEQLGEVANASDPTTVSVDFDQQMDTSVAPSINVTVGGETYSLADNGAWSSDGQTDDTYTVDLGSVLYANDTTAAGTFKVSDAAESDNGNVMSDFSRSFSVDTEDLRITSATTTSSGDAINVVLNDDYTSAGTSDFSVKLADGSSVSVDSIDTSYGHSDELQINTLGQTLSTNATPLVNLTTGGSIKDDVGNPAAASSVEAADGVAPDLSGLALTQKDGRKLNVTFDSSEELNNVTVTVTETGSKTTDQKLNESDLQQIDNGDGTYTYTTNFTVTQDGTFNVDVTEADDASNNDGSGSDAGPLGGVTVDTAGPTISPDNHGANATVTTQSDIDVSITDATNSVNADSVYVTVKDSSGTILDRGRVSAVSGLSGTDPLTITASTFAYAKGDVTVTVEAADSVGHESTKSWTFTYADQSTELTADGDSVKVNVTTQAMFDNATATVTASNTLASEDSTPTYTLDLSGTQQSGSYYYTATASGLRDGEYTVTNLNLNNSDTSDLDGVNPTASADVNTTMPYVTHAVISSYDPDQSHDTHVTVWFNEPVQDSAIDTDTLYVDGSSVDAVTGKSLSSGSITLGIDSAVQTGDMPNVTVNNAGDIEEATANNAPLNASSSATVRTVDISLSQGPNFVSLPMASGTVNLNTDLDSELSSNVDAVWTYDNGKWQSWDPAKPAGENDFHTLQGGQGYVFKMDSAVDTTWSVYNVVGGDSAETATPGQTDLEEGWNLVGQWQEGQQAQSDAFASLNSQSGRVYAQASAGAWAPSVHSGNFKPGEAYWVFVSDDDTYKESNTWTATAD